MDLNQLDVDESVNPESPLGLLRGIKYGTESYHDLFKRLCRYFITILSKSFIVFKYFGQELSTGVM